ncbi:hypothetical protein HK405_014776, partial [Cladochytrium tenue]
RTVNIRWINELTFYFEWEHDDDQVWSWSEARQAYVQLMCKKHRENLDSFKKAVWGLN